MKIQFHKSPIYPVVIAAMAFTLLVVACTSDEPGGPDGPDGSGKDGSTCEISFSLTSDGSGSGSLSEPAVCHGTTPLHFTITQTSTYTDVDGSRYTCSPKATVTLQASEDTLLVRDLQTLVTVNASPDAQRSTTGSNPVEHHAVQTFDIGGQKITFDLMHEVYTHVNAAGKTIEMPYVRLNNPKYGEAQTAQTASTRRAAPAREGIMTVRGIRLTPRHLSGPLRARTVTTAQCYDVTVSFNLDYETVNAKASQQQGNTLSFEVTYAAVVESTTEVPDPTTTCSYQTVVKEGGQGTTSPFVVKAGEPLHLQLLGTSQCSYFSMDDLETRVITRETTANVAVAVAKESIEFEGSADELKNVNVETQDIMTTGTDPAQHSCSQTITLGGGQAIVVMWDYQSLGDLQVDGETVPMPWIKLGTPQVKDIHFQVDQNKTLWVNVLLSQDVTIENLDEPQTQTLEYRVRYTAVSNPKLVKVTYRKDWQWEYQGDIQGNPLWMCRPIVYRERLYSNGTTYTDNIANRGQLGHSIKLNPGYGPYGTVSWDGGKIIFYPPNKNQQYDYSTFLDSIAIATASIAVPDMEHVRNLGSYHDEDSYLGDWGNYRLAIKYINGDLDLSGVTIEGEGLPSDLESGWYDGSFYVSHIPFDLYYDPGFVIPGNHGTILSIRVSFADCFLVIDGQMFTFNEFIDPPRFKDTEVDFPGDATHGPGKIYKSEVHQRYMGVNFYGAVIDTVFTFK